MLFCLLFQQTLDVVPEEDNLGSTLGFGRAPLNPPNSRMSDSLTANMQNVDDKLVQTDFTYAKTSKKSQTMTVHLDDSDSEDDHVNTSSSIYRTIYVKCEFQTFFSMAPFRYPYLSFPRFIFLQQQYSFPTI